LARNGCHHHLLPLLLLLLLPLLLLPSLSGSGRPAGGGGGRAAGGGERGSGRGGGGAMEAGEEVRRVRCASLGAGRLKGSSWWRRGGRDWIDPRVRRGCGSRKQAWWRSGRVIPGERGRKRFDKET